jgi:hypothetical protein
MKRMLKTIAASLVVLAVVIFISTLVALIGYFCFPLLITIGIIEVFIIGYFISKEMF